MLFRPDHQAADAAAASPSGQQALEQAIIKPGAFADGDGVDVMGLGKIEGPQIVAITEQELMGVAFAA